MRRARSMHFSAHLRDGFVALSWILVKSSADARMR